jgi:hypothetical protein
MFRKKKLKKFSVRKVRWGWALHGIKNARSFFLSFSFVFLGCDTSWVPIRITIKKELTGMSKKKIMPMERPHIINNVFNDFGLFLEDFFEDWVYFCMVKILFEFP